MSWDFDDILEMNPRSPNQVRSPVERLLDVGGASPNLLCHMADEVERRGPNYVAALFQLPFPISLERNWERLPTSPDSLSAEVTFREMALHIDDFGRFKLSDADSGLIPPPIPI